MELGSVINTAVVALVYVLLSWQMNGRFRALEHRIDRLDDSNKAEHQEIRAEVSGHVASLRSDLTQVALAVGAKGRPQTGS